jgi:hypothetical protein
MRSFHGARALRDFRESVRVVPVQSGNRTPHQSLRLGDVALCASLASCSRTSSFIVRAYAWVSRFCDSSRTTCEASAASERIGLVF